jgi:hypothetical protein
MVEGHFIAYGRSFVSLTLPEVCQILSPTKFAQVDLREGNKYEGSQLPQQFHPLESLVSFVIGFEWYPTHTDPLLAFDLFSVDSWDNIVY